MRPIQETTEAVQDFGPFVADGDLLEDLTEKSGRLRRLVPSCIALSLECHEARVTLTLVAAREEFTAPAPHSSQPRGTDPLDEVAWHDAARSGAPAGIASTLTLPILVGGRVAQSVTLYAAHPDAFRGQHAAVALVVGAWGPGAVSNADLDFTSLQSARRAPRQMREEIDIAVAVGILASCDDHDLSAARRRLEAAAHRAGVGEAQLAETVIELDRLRDRD